MIHKIKQSLIEMKDILKDADEKDFPQSDQNFLDAIIQFCINYQHQIQNNEIEDL